MWLAHGGTVDGAGYKEVIKIMTILFDQGYANKIALKESEAIGEARGEAIGEARGEAIGREEGREEGAYNKAVSTARRALSRNIPHDVIADITGLTVEEVAAL